MIEDGWHDLPVSPGSPWGIGFPDAPVLSDPEPPHRENLWVIVLEEDGSVTIFDWPIPADRPDGLS